MPRGLVRASLALAAALAAHECPAALDLSTLPSYKPQQRVSGTIRNFGFGLGGVLKLWEDAFTAIHPGIRFDDKLPTSDAAIPALVTGVADLAPDGGEATLTEHLSFFEVYGYQVTDITVASGAFDVEGKSNGPVIFVHRDNPITRLTIKQLDGIFGSERTAGFFFQAGDGIRGGTVTGVQTCALPISPGPSDGIGRSRGAAAARVPGPGRAGPG